MKQLVSVFFSEVSEPVGTLAFDPARGSSSQFSYDRQWLEMPGAFSVSPELALTDGWQFFRGGTNSSPFPLAVQDTEPDSWGRRIIERAFRKNPQNDHPRLSALDYLLAVDDFSRVGGLRFALQGAKPEKTVDGMRRTPPIIELSRLTGAARRLEMDCDTLEDLQYLQGRGTSLGGARPKCTLLDHDGSLAIGKFPSVSDERSIAKGEILALALARRAGIRAASGRVVRIDGEDVSVIRRFDREGTERLHYWSMATALLKQPGEPASWTELFEALYMMGTEDPEALATEILKRIFFNYLTNNTDDHAHNTGLLRSRDGGWRLAPAFDLNPVPLKRPTERYASKTELSPEDGPLEDLRQVFDCCGLFGVSKPLCQRALSEVLQSVRRWKEIGAGRDIGMTAEDFRAYGGAFEPIRMEAARQLAG